MRRLRLPWPFPQEPDWAAELLVFALIVAGVVVTGYWKILFASFW